MQRHLVLRAGLLLKEVVQVKTAPFSSNGSNERFASVSGGNDGSVSAGRDRVGSAVFCLALFFSLQQLLSRWL
jgi:hypothetical protein